MDIYHLTINPIDYERRIKNQAGSSRDKGQNVEIIALGKPGETSTFAMDEIRVRRLKTVFYEGGPLKFIHFNLMLFFYLLFRPLKLLHCHDLWVMPSVYLLHLFKKFSIVYDAHEYYEGLEIFNNNRIRKNLWMMVERRIIKSIDVLITVSEPIAGLYRQKYPHLQEIEVIRNLPKRIVPSKSHRGEYLPETNKKLILFQGHFKPGRGLFQMIEAMSFVKEAHLVMIGGGELEIEIRQKIEALDLQNNISIIGYIPTDQLISVTSGADLGVVLFEKTSLNYFYALPNKFFEYIMAGIPVLASNLETFTDYIEKYDVGMTVDPSNVQEISNSITKMMSSDLQIKQWKENAYKASKILNWENESVKMNQIYEKIR
jgi:glycosyltransferase involved in cell wall biosynthesis